MRLKFNVEEYAMVSLVQINFAVAVAGHSAVLQYYYYYCYYTTPSGAVAKYCNERVCVCVCLSIWMSVSISPKPHVRSLPIFCACCLWPWRSPPLVG